MVDSIANSIAASGAQTVAAVESSRTTLPYGGIDPGAGPDQLVTYPGPPGVAASDQYAVTVEQGGTPQPSFAYKSLARKPDTNRSADTSWNINFQNVHANNTCFASKMGGDFALDPWTTNAIRIMRSKDGSCQT